MLGCGPLDVSHYEKEIPTSELTAASVRIGRLPNRITQLRMQ
jgi:hypothetical protein